ERNFHTVPYMVGINKQEFGWLIPMMLEHPPTCMSFSTVQASHQT
ncbi:CES1 isoform 8, partial [Pan troglodytes]